MTQLDTLSVFATPISISRLLTSYTLKMYLRATSASYGAQHRHCILTAPYPAYNLTNASHGVPTNSSHLEHLLNITSTETSLWILLSGAIDLQPIRSNTTPSISSTFDVYSRTYSRNGLLRVRATHTELSTSKLRCDCCTSKTTGVSALRSSF
jgi:hypothetical protein